MSKATKKSSGSFLPPPPKDDSSTGNLVATILSAYDLPYQGETIEPSYVSMSVLGKEVRTGAPNLRHKERNSFKFDGSNGSSAKNELSVSAPLNTLYPRTVTFKVVVENHETLVAKCDLSSTIRINETQWLILNLRPESKIDQDQTEDGDEGTSTPTLRLKIVLSGPYRGEVAAIISLATSWFKVVDTVESASSTAVTSLTEHLPKSFPGAKFLLVPTVPIGAAAVALLPVGAGILVLGLPFFLPLLVILLAMLSTALVLGSGVYLSSPKGRESASILLTPIYSTLRSTSAGQRLIYQTGPRPSPVAISRTVLPTDAIGKLIVSLTIDFIGSSSYLIPGVGEAFDVTWAPIQTILLMAMYDDTMPSLKYISFMEEILPFTDLLPSGTLGWVREYSPLLFEEGLKKVEDFKVVVRGNS